MQIIRQINEKRNLLLKIWNVENCTCVKTLQGHTSHVYCCAISSKHDFIISGSYDKTLNIWNYEKGEILSSYETCGNCEKLNFNKSKEYLFLTENEYFSTQIFKCNMKNYVFKDININH